MSLETTLATLKLREGSNKSFHGAVVYESVRIVEQTGKKTSVLMVKKGAAMVPESLRDAIADCIATFPDEIFAACRRENLLDGRADDVSTQKSYADRIKSKDVEPRGAPVDLFVLAHLVHKDRIKVFSLEPNLHTSRDSAWCLYEYVGSDPA